MQADTLPAGEESVPQESLKTNVCGCENGSGEFCGVDGQCHIYSCEDWYEFGPRNFTGFDSASPLVCQDIGITQPDDFYDVVYYHSVSFRCRSVTPNGIRMGFNNKCSVAGTNSAFTCYGLATNTDFQPFLDEAAESQLNCTDVEYDDTSYPKFDYSVVTQKQNSGQGLIGEGLIIFQMGHNSTSEFNETLALRGAMYAKYETWTDQPTAAPTTSPPTTSPTALPTWAKNSAFTNENYTPVVVSLLGVCLYFIV